LSRRRKILFFIVMAGILLRIVHFYYFADGPFYGNNILDARNYYEDAVKIVKGDWLGGHDVFFRAPLYTYWLAFLFACFGPDSPAPIVLQWGMGVVGALMLHHLTRRLTRGLPGGHAASLLAPALALFYALQVHYETQLLDVVLQCFFGPWIVLAGMRAFRSRRGRDFIVFGLVGAFSCIARPAALPFFGLVTLAAPWLLKAERGVGPAATRLTGVTPGRRVAASLPARLRRSIWPVAAIWIGLTPPIAVVAARNYYVGHAFVPIASYAGVNFWIGNNLKADGITIAFEEPIRYQGYFDKDAVQFFSEVESRKRTGRDLNAAEIQSFWTKLAMRDIKADPLRAFLLQLKKFVVFWNGYELSNNNDIHVVVEFNPILRALQWVFCFRALAPLALLGLFEWLRLRRVGRDGAIYLLFAFTLMAGVIGFFINMRYRYPFVVVMLPMSAFGVTRLAILAREWKTVAQAKRWTAIGAIVAASLFVNLPFFDLAHKQETWMYDWSVANDFRRLGRYDEAIAMYRRVMQMSPTKLSPRNNLGELDYELSRDALGRHDTALATQYQAEALSLFKSILKMSDDPIYDCLALNNIGAVLELQGKLKDAEACYRRAVELDPKYLKGWINLADLSARRGDWESAKTQWENGIGSKDSPMLDALLGLARYYDHKKEPARARAYVLQAAGIDALQVAGYVKAHQELQPYFSASFSRQNVP
jgi:tetratricopeptide (TPR) repeat protein